MTKTVTVKLETPVEFNKATYSELTFRKAKARDFVAADLVKGDARRGFAILASMADVPLQVIEELDIDDFEAIGAEVAPLMGKSRAALSEAAQTAV